MASLLLLENEGEFIMKCQYQSRIVSGHVYVYCRCLCCDDFSITVDFGNVPTLWYFWLFFFFITLSVNLIISMKTFKKLKVERFFLYD